jgi:hypothetical protein
MEEKLAEFRKKQALINWEAISSLFPSKSKSSKHDERDEEEEFFLLLNDIKMHFFLT